MGNRKQPVPCPPEPGTPEAENYNGEAPPQFRPNPPPAPPPSRAQTRSPGTWKARSNYNGSFEILSDSVSWQIGIFPRRADAKLAAAAPRLLAVLQAVLHQLEHGEASDVLDLGVVNPDTQRDLRWCRDEIKMTLKSLL